jgi:ubiquinone/menaquinone biosynthesis C-methylase UbiE
LRALLKLVLFVVFGLWALITLYIVVLLRERYSRSGPIPVSQAGALLTPLRRWIHPVPQMLEKFRIRPGHTVVEVGPGPGYFTIEAARLVGPTGRVLCVDLQPGMLKMMQQRLEAANIANAHPVIGDAMRLPLPEASADAAFLVAVLGEIPDRVAAIRELRRVLKPGGVLSFSETLTDPDYVLQRELRDLCRAVGFEEMETTSERLGYTMSFSRP